MNKAELIAELQSKFDTLISITPSTPEGDWTFYVARIIDVNGDLASDTKVSFWVKYDNDPINELAFWNRSEPKPMPQPNPTQLLLDYLNGLVPDSIRSYKIIEGTFNATTRTAEVSVVLPNLSRANFLLEYDAGAFIHTLIP